MDVLDVCVIQAFECIAQATLHCSIGRKRLKFSSQILPLVTFQIEKAQWLCMFLGYILIKVMRGSDVWSDQHPMDVKVSEQFKKYWSMRRRGHQGTRQIFHFKGSHDMKSYSQRTVSFQPLTRQLRAQGGEPPGLIWWLHKGAWDRIAFKCNCIGISLWGRKAKFWGQLHLDPGFSQALSHVLIVN